MPLTAGLPWPLGATMTEDGTNFAVFSENATAITLCLFDDAGRERQIALPERDGDVWHGHVTGVTAGQLYGYRAHGPYRPEEGHRFNHHKLLLDPYATQITGHPVWSPALMGYTMSDPRKDLSFDKRDSAADMPRCVVTAPLERRVLPQITAMEDSVIYEAHVKGLTMRLPGVSAAGSFAAAASDPVLDHLNKLGVTAIEFLPAQAFLTDHFLHERGLTNYWGYQTIGFFAPHPAYLSTGRITEFRDMVDRFHAAGIEVLMDVVYNHTGEGNELGPTLCFRGLDNRAYYRLAGGGRHCINDTGTGNTINIEHPMVLRMVMDSLRYWVEVMGVDGFRFDLCSVLGRTPGGFDPGAAFFDAIRQDPVLGRVKLIAEPWDIGPGGYQLGGYPPPFSEWNDRYRDGVRRFWRADPGCVPDLANAITGSANLFDHSGRPATASVNFIAAHDGFTLTDIVSYNQRHNKANGEDGRDGHGENYSDNMGHEGPSETLRAVRAQRRRAMMATLLVSQGTPMILSGDEMGHSQNGNNNSYNQDNETTWLDWAHLDAPFLAFTQKLIALRQRHPVLRQKRFLHSRERARDGLEDLFWHRADGTPMTQQDWLDPERTHLIAELRTASGTPEYAMRDEAICLVFNAGAPVTVTLPDHGPDTVWQCELNSAEPAAQMTEHGPEPVAIAAQSVAVFTYHEERE